ncbi:MAG TPA: BPSL0067 family protein [Magnetospirillum sp.]|jgi:peptidoglycan hydrolase-like protein with peptidoglycan-binding domain|nr:BPSL0067 family protein [Magnetospirillum sp.]
MPGFDFRSLFTEAPERQWASGPGASGDWRVKQKSLLEEDADPRFPAFQDAWKQGAGLTDLFGPQPFRLQGTVAPSGGDNTRADVAKVQTLLGKAGYLDLGQDGPSGYANPGTDKAIRDFQQDNGLEVDGVLKPGGPSITKLGGLLGGQSEPHDKSTSPFISEEEARRIGKIVNKSWDTPGATPPYFPEPKLQQWPGNDSGAPNPSGDLLSILLGEKPWPTTWSQPKDPPTTFPTRKPEDGPRLSTPADPFPNHTINQDGVDASEMLPYRLAPLGEGFREPTGEEKIAAASKRPFGSAEGADRWAAGNMADVLLGRGDYTDAITHFRGEVDRNPAEAMPYLAAVHQLMADKNPAAAAKFATQMAQAGLAEETAPKPSGDGSVLSAPIPPTVTPGPIPPAKPGETDIVIPADPKPAPDQKPETTPAPIPPTPVPAPEPPPETAPQPEPQPQQSPKPSPAPEPTNPQGPSGENSPPDAPSTIGYVSSSSGEEILKKAKGGKISHPKGEGCVALVKDSVPDLADTQTKNWKPGPKMAGPDNPPLRPGTALATFGANGKYGGDGVQHAVVFDGYDTKDGQRGMWIVEQSSKMDARRSEPALPCGKLLRHHKISGYPHPAVVHGDHWE